MEKEIFRDVICAFSAFFETFIHKGIRQLSFIEKTKESEKHKGHERADVFVLAVSPKAHESHKTEKTKETEFGIDPSGCLRFSDMFLIPDSCP